MTRSATTVRAASEAIYARVIRLNQSIITTSSIVISYDMASSELLFSQGKRSDAAADNTFGERRHRHQHVIGKEPGGCNFRARKTRCRHPGQFAAQPPALLASSANRRARSGELYVRYRPANTLRISFLYSLTMYSTTDS